MKVGFKTFLFLVFLLVFLLLNKGNNLSFLNSFNSEFTREEVYLEDDEVVNQIDDLEEDHNEETSFEVGMELLPQSDGTYFEYVDQETGKTVIQSDQYTDADYFSEGLAMVGKYNRDQEYHEAITTYGFIDTKGRIRIPFKFADAGRFGSGLAPVQLEKNGKYGYINKAGELVLEAEYLNLTEFRFGRAIVSNKKSYPFMSHYSTYAKMGFMNTKGEMVIPQNYDYVYPFSEGLAAVNKGGRFGFIDTSGNIKIGYIYSYAAPFVNGMAPVIKNDRLGFIDKNRKAIVPFEYQDYKYVFDNTTPYTRYYKKYKKYITTEGYMILKKNNKWGYLSFPSQKVLVPFEYTDIEVMNATSGEIKASKNGKWGIINLENEVLVDFKYEDLDEENEDMRAFKKDGLWGYMNDEGEEVIEPRFNYKSKFYNGKAYVNENGSYIYINKRGKTVN